MDSTACLVRSRAGDEVRFRIDGDLVVPPDRLSSDRVERRQPVDLVAEQLDAEALLFVRGVHLDDVAADPEFASGEFQVVALVLNLDELAEDLVPSDALPALERQQHAVVGFGRTETVDARHAGDDDDVAALEERARRREPHAIDLVVDRRFLLDVRIGGRNVGFGLVVVVVADEVLDGVLGKEAAELLVELRGERLVVDHHQRRPVHARDRLRHRERLARPGDAQQYLIAIAAVQALGQLANGAFLVARELEVGHEVEAVVDRGHSNR